MGGGGESVHIRSGFSHNLLGGASSHSGNRIQPLQVIFKREHSPLDFFVQLLNQRIEFVNVFQLGFEHEPLMCADETVQRPFEFIFFMLHSSKGHPGEDFRIGCPR